jgi:hypothetical protein
MTSQAASSFASEIVPYGEVEQSGRSPGGRLIRLVIPRAGQKTNRRILMYLPNQASFGMESERRLLGQ